jgi:hypothetical protein
MIGTCRVPAEGERRISAVAWSPWEYLRYN